MRSAQVLLVALLASCSAVGCGRRDPAPATTSSTAPTESGQSTASATNEGADRPRGLLPVGSAAPDFSVRAHSGQDVSLRELRGRVVVLYFYPKDGTPGCTVEAQQFSLAHEDLTAAGGVVLGVSSDDNVSHAEFARSHGLPFLLLPDEDHTLARAYGVRTTFGMTQRVTFVIDKAGNIARVYDEVSPKNHAREILADLERLGGTDGKPAL